MSGAVAPLPNTPSWRSAQLKHRDNFTLPSHYLQSSTVEIVHCLLPIPYLLTVLDRFRCYITSAIETVSLNNLRITIF
jgi:hypothetical protein